MRIYLAKTLSNIPFYGDVPDLTQESSSVIDFLDYSDNDFEDLYSVFINPTNILCDAALDLGDYQYYNTDQCKLLLDWVKQAIIDNQNNSLNNFFINLKDYLQYAVVNSTGIAIEL